MDREVNNSLIELWYGTPLWLVRILLPLFLVVGGFFLTAVYHFDAWLPNEPVGVKYFFLLLGVAFLSVVVRPRYWQGWAHFTASYDGIRFPSDFPLKTRSTWLLVPWDDVGVIKITKFRRTEGISIEISISDEDKDKYFPSKRLFEKLFGTSPSDPRYTVVGYSEAFNNKYSVVNKLNNLKEKYAR